MKKILMTVVVLAMILPTFGQKLNSRGEKMVSSVYVYEQGKKLVNTYEFEYDEQGNMLSMKIDKGKSCYVLSQKGNKVNLEFYYGGKKEYGDETYVIQLNEDGLIASLKKIDTQWSKNNYAYMLYEFEYTYDPYVKKQTISKEKEQSLMIQNKNSVSDRGGTSYFNYYYKEGNPCIGVNGQINNKIFSNKMCDINISLMALSVWGMTKNISVPTLLLLSQWCPYYCKNLPLMDLNDKGQRTIFYEYDYYDGNIVGIREYRDMGDLCEAKLRSIAKINYVEED